MPRNVSFNDEIMKRAKEVCPSMEFSLFAQTAVREKIDREWLFRRSLVMGGGHD